MKPIQEDKTVKCNCDPASSGKCPYCFGTKRVKISNYIPVVISYKPVDEGFLNRLRMWINYKRLKTPLVPRGSVLDQEHRDAFVTLQRSSISLSGVLVCDEDGRLTFVMDKNGKK